MKKNDIVDISIKDVNNKLKIPKWDKRLDDYNNYVKEYIKHYKKSKKGNLISLCKYPYMRAKSDTLGGQINIAQSNMFLTKKQIKRVFKIKTKLVDACCD